MLRRQVRNDTDVRMEAPAPAMVDRLQGYPHGQAAGGFSALRCDSVKTSPPVSVTPTECSNCADSERSRVTAVHPSDII